MSLKEHLANSLEMKDAVTEFQQALFYYKNAQDFNSDNAELNYKIGSSLLFTNQKEEGFYYLKKAN